MAKKIKLIDLSVPIEAVPSEPLPLEVTHEGHKQGTEVMKQIFGCTENDLPDGLGWASDRLNLITHNGTHLDAPWHFFPTSEGKKAKTIDEIPLEWCYSDGVVLDMRHKKIGDLITAADIQEALKKINYQIKPGDIVLIMTGADKLWGKAEYFTNFPGMGRKATLYLIKKGVKIMGIDAWGFDRPFNIITEEFKKTKNSKIIWAAHYAGIEKEYCHIEKLANLDKLPPHGFKIACFPINIKGGSAGWTRPVAFIEED